MKTVLLPERNESFGYYKADLHCHSTVSDGSKTPEELKRDYMAHGYSVIAYTDHDAFLMHNDLTDENFVALNGYEMGINEDSASVYEDRRTCHLCYIALDEHNDRAVCYHREKYIGGNAAAYRDRIKFDETLPDFERVYTGECINEMIKRGRDAGFFVTYNHPTWSVEEYPEYMRYEGMNAMEIVNFGCVIVGNDDDNGHCYDDMLRGGKRLFCIGTDDNHNRHGDDDPLCDSYGGYTVIGAPSLTYADIAKALENGCFYTSTGNYKNEGPEILSLVVEDGKVKIKTSGARYITYLTGRRRCDNRAAVDGDVITEAEFDIGDEKWFRLTVTDNKGFKAYTNAYFTDSL